MKDLQLKVAATMNLMCPRIACRLVLFLFTAGLLSPAGFSRGADVFRTGLEVVVADGFRELKGKKVGLVTNPTGVDRRLVSLIDLLAEARGVELKAIFGPEHGARGAAAAGAKVADAKDPSTGTPVYSLFGRNRSPSQEVLRKLDVMIFDIQDIGVRTYTYLATLIKVMEAAAKNKVEVWVLDRPVPIGGETIEGPLLSKSFESFVGPHTLPLRHGLTAGEFARLVNKERKIGARLKVVRMQGYTRRSWYGDSGLPWVAPSPNIPTPETALVYAGMVLVEGVETLSEGRGTTRPFKLIGAPWLDGRRLAKKLNSLRLPGVLFRAAWFKPSFSKFSGEECSGVELHVTDARACRPVTVAVHLLSAIRRQHPAEFKFRERAFDRLAGTDTLRKALEAGKSPTVIIEGWKKGLAAFLKRREPYLLYR